MQSISKMRRLIFLLIVLIQSGVIKGQESDFVYGQLVDSDDQTPIPFAHISIMSKAKGTVSNMDGGFRIPGKYYKSRDTLFISSIGYLSKKIPLLSLDQNLRNVIVLERKEEVLNEITLETSHKSRKTRQRIDHSSTSLTDRVRAKDIVQLAIDRIPDNYPFQPFSYVGYYRDYQINKGNYINLNEAVLQVYDEGFGLADSVKTQTRIYKYNKNLTFPEDTLANMPYSYDNRKKYVSSTELGTPKAGRNEYTLLRIHDALRNYNINSYDFVNRLDTDFIDNHKFKFLSGTSIDSIPLYAISIYKRWGKYFTAKGEIFISKEDYKIYKMQYAVYDKSVGSAAKNEHQTISNKLEKKNRKLGKLLYEIIVEYQLFNGIMYPNYISFNNSFQSLNPPVIYPKHVRQETRGDYTALIDPDIIKLSFSLDSLQKKAIKNGNYRLWFNNRLLKFLKPKISGIDIVEFNLARNTLTKYMPFKQTEDMTQEEITKRQFFKIYDASSYELYIGPYRHLNQYREFFVQELNMDMKKPGDKLYMIKDQPIFKNQPIAPKENLEEYWMNTPLKE